MKFWCRWRISIAGFSSKLVNLVDSDLHDYYQDFATQTRLLAALLLGQILMAILFFFILTRQVSRLQVAQAALVDANANLRNSESTIRQSQAELATARQRLLDGIEAIPDGFALYDADDRLVISNSVLRSRFGMDGEAILPGQTFEEILRRRLAARRLPVAGGEEEAWIADRLREHRAGTTAREMRMDGDRTYRIAERRTVDGGIVTVVTDITELKEREQRLHESQEILRSLLDNVPVVVTMTDVSRRLLLLNRAAERRYDRRAIDVIGRDLLRYPAGARQIARYQQEPCAAAGNQAAADRPCLHDTGRRGRRDLDRQPHSRAERSRAGEICHPHQL